MIKVSSVATKIWITYFLATEVYRLEHHLLAPATLCKLKVKDEIDNILLKCLICLDVRNLGVTYRLLFAKGCFTYRICRDSQ